MSLRRFLALAAALAALPVYAHWGSAAYRQAERPVTTLAAAQHASPGPAH